MKRELVRCEKCIRQGSTSCPLLNGETKENIIRYQCPLFEALEEPKPTPLEALNIIRVYKLLSKSSNTPVCYIDLKQCFPEEWGVVEKELRALEIIKELFDFDFAIRFGDNQPMIKITNKRNGQYWELPETTEICDLLKEVLL